MRKAGESQFRFQLRVPVSRNAEETVLVGGAAHAFNSTLPCEQVATVFGLRASQKRKSKPLRSIPLRSLFGRAPPRPPAPSVSLRLAMSRETETEAKVGEAGAGRGVVALRGAQERPGVEPGATA